MISGTDVNFVLAQQATNIIILIWKFVHRFIATCIHLRKDEERWLSKSDLELMFCFHERISFDPLILITKSLEETQFPSFRGIYLCGGHLITLLAQDVGFSLDTSHAMTRRFLGEEELIRRGFIKIIRTRNGIQRLLVGRDEIPGENVAPPPPSHDQVGPSSAP